MGIRVGALFCLVIAGAFGQPATDYSHFEVATVKPSVPPPNLPAGAVPAPQVQGGPGSTNPGQISYRYISLGALILMAFDIRPMQMVAPRSSDLFDIGATLPADTSKEQLRTMLQNLLKERFHFTYHYESRILPVYALTVGKDGPKLKVSTTTSEPVPPGTRIGVPDKDGFPTFPPGYSGAVAIPSNGRLRLSGQKVKIDALTGGMLASRLDRPMVDQTGLTGEYDFRLEVEWMQRPDAPAIAPIDAAPTVFQALEKLGLKLEKKDLPFDVLIVDGLDKVPTEN